MYTIQKEFSFSASHVLDGLPDGHKCGRLHGHNYRVIIELSSNELNEHGFIVDYGDLSPLKQLIDETLDHRHLNGIVPGQPSAENIARWLAEWCKTRWRQTNAVKVSETEKTWAEYRF